MLEFEIKAFEALSVHELYAILQLRSEVFVVEQNCVYQDIDGKDQKALHLMATFKGETVGYARLFDAGDYFDEASIGRVVIAARYRDRKWGHELMQAAITGVRDYFKRTEITISAQLYLEKFYQSHHFITIGQMYLEDGIPHVRMQRNR